MQKESQFQNPVQCKKRRSDDGIPNFFKIIYRSMMIDI